MRKSGKHFLHFPASRAMIHGSAWWNLPRLRELTRERHSIEEIAFGIQRYAGGFFGPDQVWVEILSALKEVEARQPRYVVEIGTAGGGTLAMWSRVSHPQATLISVDLPGGEFGGGSSWLRAPFFRRMGLEGQTIQVIRGDSHDHRTLDRVRGYLQGNPIDLLYIDGDHTEEGVTLDYSMYGPLVRKGGLIVFHDIAVDSPRCGVAKLWKSLSVSLPSKSIVAPAPTYGIGILYA